MIDWRAVVERVFKEESARILAALIRLCRSFDWAEEAMQDTFARALAEWPAKGVPANPGAWIMTVARRCVIAPLQDVGARTRKTWRCDVTARRGVSKHRRKICRRRNLRRRS
jgi:predicted RNA polymerase sigma factor